MFHDWNEILLVWFLLFWGHFSSCFFVVCFSCPSTPLRSGFMKSSPIPQLKTSVRNSWLRRQTNTNLLCNWIIIVDILWLLRNSSVSRVMLLLAFGAVVLLFFFFFLFCSNIIFLLSDAVYSVALYWCVTRISVLLLKRKQKIQHRRIEQRLLSLQGWTIKEHDQGEFSWAWLFSISSTTHLQFSGSITIPWASLHPSVLGRRTHGCSLVQGLWHGLTPHAKLERWIWRLDCWLEEDLVGWS